MNRMLTWIILGFALQATVQHMSGRPGLEHSEKLALLGGDTSLSSLLSDGFSRNQEQDNIVTQAKADGNEISSQENLAAGASQTPAGTAPLPPVPEQKPVGYLIQLTGQD